MQVRYGDRSGLLKKFQVVCMSVKMFYVVFGRNQVLVLHVVSQFLRLFCVSLVVFKICCGEFQDLPCCLSFSFRVVWLLLFVRLFQVVVGCLA